MSRTPAEWLEPQPPPTGDGPSVTAWLVDQTHLLSPEVVALLLYRREQGRARYGTSLRAYNGRSALADQVQEAVDGLVYAAQAVVEAQTEPEAKRAGMRLRKWRDLLETLVEGG